MMNKFLSEVLRDPDYLNCELIKVELNRTPIAILELSGVDNGKLSYRTTLIGIDENRWESLCDTPTFTTEASFVKVSTKQVIPADSIILIYSSPGWVLLYLDSPPRSLWDFLVKVVRRLFG